MEKFQKISELNISKFIYFIILILLAVYFLNSKKREGILFKYINTQDTQIDSLEDELEKLLFENSLLKSNIQYTGYTHPLINNVLKENDSFCIIAITKFNESVFARAKFLGVLSTLSEEIKNLKIKFIADYKTNSLGELYQIESMPDFEDTPVIYLVNNEGCILLSFNIKDPIESKNLSFITNVFKKTYIRFANRLPLGGNQ